MKFTSEDVAGYYDHNTRAFLARGLGGSEGAIHRPVWGEGVSSPEAAVHFVHELLLGELAAVETSTPRLLDLGCGVGASLRYLVERSGARGIGITVSALQAELARGSTLSKMSDRVEFLEGDFCADVLPGEIDLAYGIESFVQATDAPAFFERVAKALRPRGRLALVDDFLAGDPHEPWVREFQRGWRASSLLAPEDADALADAHGLGLLRERDLTPLLALDRPRDRAIALVVALGRPLRPRSPRFQSLLGGNALRQCLKRGLVSYRFRIWCKREGEL